MPESNQASGKGKTTVEGKALQEKRTKSSKTTDAKNTKSSRKAKPEDKALKAHYKKTVHESVLYGQDT